MVDTCIRNPVKNDRYTTNQLVSFFFSDFWLPSRVTTTERMTKKWMTIIFCHMKDEGFDVQIVSKPKMLETTREFTQPPPPVFGGKKHVINPFHNQTTRYLHHRDQETIAVRTKICPTMASWLAPGWKNFQGLWRKGSLPSNSANGKLDQPKMVICFF